MRLFIIYTDFGVEKGIRLEGLSEAQISKALEDLVKAGEALKAWKSLPFGPYGIK